MEPSSTALRAAVAASLLLACREAGAVSGDLTYADVPRVTALDPGRFHDLLLESQERVVRIAVFGDSQETDAGANGDQYLANLNASFARVFGPATESMLYSNQWSVDFPRWLAATDPSTARVASAVAPARVPPGIEVAALVRDPAAVAPVTRIVFNDDASYLADDTLEGGAWFAPGTSLTADILGVTRKAGGALRWRNEPTDSDRPMPAWPTQEGLLSYSAKAPAGRFEWLSTPPLARGDRRHVQLVLSGDSPVAPFELVGVRFRSDAPPRGVVVLPLSRGGMQATDLVRDHAEAGDMLRAWGPSIAVIHYGTNDSLFVRDLDEWRSRLAAVVALVRAQSGDPALPIILASELRCGFTPASADIVDRLAVVAHEMALGDPGILALNLTRIAAEAYRWDVNRYYLSDNVHFLPYAQRMLAKAFVGELVAALGIDDPSCDEDAWADCVRSFGASCQTGGCVIVADVDALARQLPWSGSGSDCADADGDGYTDACGSGGPADVNRDGLVDAGDIAAVLGMWGTADPWADITGNGVVDAADLAIVLSQWGAG